MEALRGVTDPEQKRRIIGEKFIRLFEEQARHLGRAAFPRPGDHLPGCGGILGPGAQPGAAHQDAITTSAGCREDLSFELVEPLRYLFKDEVRAVGEALGLPEAMVWRQPFPGPGLGVRCLGEVTCERLARLRAADAIFQDELARPA